MKTTIATLAVLGVPGAPTFDLAPGSYTFEDVGTSSITITATKPVVWTWNRTSGVTPAASVASGGTAKSLQLSLTTSFGGGTKTSAVRVTAEDSTWDITLVADDPQSA